MHHSHRLGRRAFLSCTSGCLAAGSLPLFPRWSLAAALGDAQVLAPRPAHAPAKAKQLIFVFLTGGFSHVDTFDYKPKLQADDGKMVKGASLREMSLKPLVASPFKFARCGQSGLMISELFTHLGALADDLSVIRTMHTDILEHFQATLAMHTGSSTIPLPSIGSWLSYGLGTLNANLPPFVVLAEHLPYAGAQVWDSNFLPPHHQGVRVVPGNDPIPNLKSPPPPRSATLAQLEQMMLRDVNEDHARLRPGDLNLRARMQTFDTAQGMLRAAPEVFDLSRETATTLEHYGVGPADKTSFAWQCLVARRLIERGVRVVELIDTGSHDNWDSHGDMQAHRPKAQRVDRALAALFVDLKRRGLFDETLIAICTEFGRSPWDETRKGRNHWHKAFSCLLAGAGVKGGTAYGETDEYGGMIVKDPVHVHDYHATILHLLGLDHTRLTYRYSGRDFRLTDVSGRVMKEIIS